MEHQTDSKLDHRFSDPGVDATAWSETAAALESAQLFWMTTVRRNERPHVTPLVAIWVDDVAYFCTGAEEQKNLNLANNRKVALTTGCNRWDEGLDVVIEGDATNISDPATLQRLTELWAQKWDGRWQFDVGDGSFTTTDAAQNPLVYAVEPTKIIAFAKSPFAQTTYSFGGGNGS